MAAETTTTLAGEVKTYLEARFLKRSKYLLIHKEGGQKGTHDGGEGKAIKFSRYTRLPISETPLTEGANGNETSMALSNVTMTLAEYGRWVKIAKLLSLTSIDERDKEKIDVVAQNMGETLDQLVRAALYSGATAQLGGGKTVLSNIASNNTMTTTELRKAIRTLKKNQAMRYDDGLFLAKVGPDTSYDIMGDSVWVNAHTYKDGKELYMGEVGKIHGARVIETTNQKSEASTVTVYSNIVHGANAFGVKDLQGDRPKLYIKTPNSGDTSNPLDRFHTAGWAATYAAKVLVAAWIVNIKTAASA